uniref:Uncharacterized protein n=1 Tax=Piliocolobus tephrosceles TaxID=591936 RepID=A0A8C9H3Q2_9PRIM
MHPQNYKFYLTLNQLLVEMDGFNNTVHIMVIAATNRIDTLDSALLRPGRFDRIVYVPLPDVGGRKKILEIYVKKIKSNLTSTDIEKMAKLTPGFSGADLENIVNEATILATRNNKSFVTVHEFYEARDKVSMGPERKSNGNCYNNNKCFLFFSMLYYSLTYSLLCFCFFFFCFFLF